MPYSRKDLFDTDDYYVEEKWSTIKAWKRNSFIMGFGLGIVFAITAQWIFSYLNY